MTNYNFDITKNERSDISFIIKMTSRSYDLARAQFFENGAFDAVFFGTLTSRSSNQERSNRKISSCKF